jgi:hypothetical protein
MDGLVGPIVIEYAHDSPFRIRNLYTDKAWPCSPAPNTENPFSRISNDSSTISTLEAAELNTTTVIVSDWNHFTSIELQNIAETVNIDTM